MMNPRLTIIVFAFWTSFAITGTAAAEIVVVINKSNPVESMSRAQVIDMFMGKYVAFPDGSRATPIEPYGDQNSRKSFYKLLINFNLSRVNAYWSRIRFTGRATPPEPKPSDEEVAKFIGATENAIGYIDSKYVTANLKVVHTLGTR
jgi:ABC-type phosphate transport system substrate-binding protein